MKEGRDFSIINKINGHFDDLINDLSSINTFDCFVESKEKRRAILFDFLQIGELTNQLSKKFLKNFNNINTNRLISIRNRIVHGYSTVRDDVIYDTLKNDFPLFIKELNEFARIYYSKIVHGFIGKEVKVIIDRPIGYHHKGLVYPINYGYIEELTALDGEFQDAYLLDENESVTKSHGTVIAIVHRYDDVEDKLVVSMNQTKRRIEDIEKIVSFQEQFYKHDIIIK